jgi:hypothetical protein
MSNTNKKKKKRRRNEDRHRIEFLDKAGLAVRKRVGLGCSKKRAFDLENLAFLN